MDETTVFGGDETGVKGDAGGLMQEAATALGGDGQGGLEEAMQAVDLGLLNEEQVADLESGDATRIEQAVRAAQKSGEVRMPGRISLKAIENPEEKRSLIEATRMLRDGEAKSLREALGRVFELEGAVAKMEAEPRLAPEPEPFFQASGVEAMELRLAQMQQECEARKQAYDYEGAEALMAEMAEARMDLREAQKAGEMQQGHVAEFVAGEDASRGRVLEQYGVLLRDPQSEFNHLLDAEIALAERRNDAILSSADWPEKIASRTYQKYEVLMGGGVADPWGERQGNRAASAPRTGVRMPGSPVGVGANSTALTASAALSEFERLSPEEQKSVLDQLDRNRL